MASLINLTNLRAISKNNESFIREVLEVFCSNTPRDIGELETEHGKGNVEAVRYYSHKLKSSCFTIGFEKGYEVFKAVETMAEGETEHEGIEALILRAKEICEQAIREIQTEIAQ